MPSGCGRRCATLSEWTGCLWWPTTQLAISHRTFIVDARGAGYLEMHWRILGSLEVSLAHVLSEVAVGILSLVLRTVISRGRDDYGAVEKTLKGILTICTVLVFPVVVASILHGRLSFERAESLSAPQDMYFEGRPTVRIELGFSIREAHGLQLSGLMFGSSSFQSVPSRGLAGAPTFFLMEEDVIQFPCF